MNYSLRRTLACLGLVGAGLATLAAAGAPASFAPLEQGGFKYSSMARCNTKDCHGADAPKGSPALNEYGIWKGKDPHAKAFTTLYKAPSKTMGQAMGIAKAHESQKCLQCHSKVVPEDQVVAGQKWSLQNGVSCEVCHGPGEKWVDPHAAPKEKNWTHETSVANGMFDLRDVRKWAVMCASCHLQIDHDMIAAGHPRLHFELVDYNARTGAHWKTEKHPSMAADFDSRAWTIGQLVSLAEALRNLGRQVKGGANEQLLARAWEQTAAYAYLLNGVKGFKPLTEIPYDTDKLNKLADEVDEQAKNLTPADESMLPLFAAAEPPKDFAAARQVALAFRALSKKAEAKPAIDALCELIVAKSETTFDPAKYAAAFEPLKALFK